MIHMNKKKLHLATALICTAVSLAFSNSSQDEAINYYALRELISPQKPRFVRVMKFSNQSLGKRIIEEGILVTYKNRHAQKVEIAGNFSNWRPQVMERGNHGIWFYLITNPVKNSDIHYKYRVDGIWTYDPHNPDRIDDGMGSFLSIAPYFRQTEGKHVTYRIEKNGIVEFRIYKPNARFISLVGDFNHWNPENDHLKPGKDGIWRIKKRLAPGEYRYKYIIDGKWEVDYFNDQSALDDTGGICSVVRIPK